MHVYSKKSKISLGRRKSRENKLRFLNEGMNEWVNFGNVFSYAILDCLREKGERKKKSFIISSTKFKFVENSLENTAKTEADLHLFINNMLNKKASLILPLSSS